MIRSMTGYGKAEQLYNTNVITVEIKTLNSKQLDLSLRTPQELKPYELLYRKTSLASSTIFPTERVEVKQEELGQMLFGA